MIARILPAVFALLLLAAPARAVEVQRVVSPGGIEAWLVEDHGNPIISMDLGFEGGGALDPAGKEGLAHLVSGLLDEGAGELDSQAFQKRLANLSISLSFDAGLDTFQGVVRTLTENREAAFELLGLALTQARFDPEPVERIRSQILVQLERESEDPNSIASLALRRAMFPDHPYGRPVKGTLENLPTITVEDLRRFVAERLARDRLYVAVVGDITAAELSRLLDKTFLALPERAAPFTLAETAPEAAGEVLVIERDVPQSVVLFGHGAVKRDDPDFYAAYIANYILGGGGFSSRLYGEVREKRGLAYSVYAYLAGRRIPRGDPRRMGPHGGLGAERRGAQGRQDLSHRLLPPAVLQHRQHRRHAAGHPVRRPGPRLRQPAQRPDRSRDPGRRAARLGGAVPGRRADLRGRRQTRRSRVQRGRFRRGRLSQSPREPGASGHRLPAARVLC
jgi:zinc protease